MSNDHLRAALQHAGLTADQLADTIQVDERTVRRWLSGQTPHARQRAKVARALELGQAELWPELAIEPPPRPSKTSEPVDAYTNIRQPGAPDLSELTRDARRHIDLLGRTLRLVLATPGMTGLLAARANDGCSLRLLPQDPSQLPAPLLNQPGIEIRVLEAELPHLLYRYDDQLLLLLYAGREDTDYQPPLFHVSQRTAPLLFNWLVEHYERLWSHDSTRPLNPEQDIDRYKTESPRAAVPPTGPRRWPGQRPSS